MRETRHYEVARHRFSVTAKAAHFGLMDNYEPFRLPQPALAENEYKTSFRLTIESGERPDFNEELRQEDEGQIIICGRTAEGKPVFEFIWGGRNGWVADVCNRLRRRTAHHDDVPYEDGHRQRIDGALCPGYG